MTKKLRYRDDLLVSLGAELAELFDDDPTTALDRLQVVFLEMVVARPGRDVGFEWRYETNLAEAVKILALDLGANADHDWSGASKIVVHQP